MKPPKKEDPARLHKLPSGTVLAVSADEPPHMSPTEIAFFANYSEYAKTLRAWLVAYGIGAPVLFLTNNQLSAALKVSPHRDWIVDLFLLGVALQVILAFVNKWCAWHLYVGEYDSEFQSRRSYKFWAWLNERSWIDLSIDALSLVSFAVSTLLAVRVFS
ncbi:hypothetical protein [Xanthomonas cannabis]|uniref:hypothetical protein n=1 Tax=Xanthomonas cannabis TaxID=1885674 RepID=UPI00141BEBF0|nr:hypothetical protein [Xanthomonas cannabis]NIK03286.1 hypothetical protein [Xanthomonas cannabis]